MSQPELFTPTDTGYVAAFDGETFDQALDGPRLNAQLKRVRAVMLDGQWRSLRDIREHTGDPEASISARLRDMRKSKFGGYVVERRRVSGGLFEYRVKP